MSISMGLPNASQMGGSLWSDRPGIARWPDPSPFFEGSGTVLMRPDNGAVDQHVFIVVIRGQIAKNPLDHTAFTPAAQTPVDVFSVSETDRKITPRDARAIAIQHGFHEKTVIRGRAANMTLPTGKKAFHSLPLVIAQTVSPHLLLSLKAGKTVSTGNQKVQPLRHTPRN